MRHQLEGKTQEDRSRKRKRFLKNTVMAPRFPGQTFLEQMAVSQAVASDYTKRLEAFKTFEKQASQTSSYQQVRRELQHLSESSLLRRHRHLRRLQDSGRFGGCKTGCKPKRRPAQSKEVSARMGKGEQNRQWAILLPSTFGAFTLQGEDVVGPTRSHPDLALNLHPEERLETSKIGLANESILLDSPVMPFLNVGLKKLAQRRKGRYLFNLDYLQLRNIWENSVKDSGLPKNHSVLYQLRHSSPSHDRLHNLRSALAVKMRGRWRADSSVRRYEAPSSTIPTASKPTAGEVPFSTDSVRTAGPRIFFSPVKPDSKRTLWVVEFLSGCANLSKQFAAAGFHALAYDIIFGSMDRETICFVSLF